MAPIVSGVAEPSVAELRRRQTPQIRCSNALLPPGQKAHRRTKAEEQLIHLMQYAVVYR